MDKFSVRRENIEVRTCNQQLLQNGEHTTAECVVWSVYKRRKYCYTIAYWKRDRDGFNLYFVGDFDLDWNKGFSDLTKIMQEYLERWNNE